MDHHHCRADGLHGLLGGQDEGTLPDEYEHAFFYFASHVVKRFFSANCPFGWTFFSETGFCYLFNPVPLSFDAAADSCADAGARLASVYTQTEHDFILS